MTIGRHNSTCSTWSRRDDPGRSPGQRVALARPGRAACGGTAISAGNALLLYHTSDWLPHAYIASAAMSIGAAWLYSKARQRPDCSAASCWHCFWVSWLASRFGLTDAAWPAFVLLAFYSVAIAFLIARFGYAWIRRIGGCAVPFSRRLVAPTIKRPLRTAIISMNSCGRNSVTQHGLWWRSSISVSMQRARLNRCTVPSSTDSHRSGDVACNCFLWSAMGRQSNGQGNSYTGTSPSSGLRSGGAGHGFVGGCPSTVDGTLRGSRRQPHPAAYVSDLSSAPVGAKSTTFSVDDARRVRHVDLRRRSLCVLTTTHEWSVKRQRRRCLLD